MATLHRPWNGDGMDQLVSLVHMLAELSRHLPIVFPVHPAGQTADAGCRAPRAGADSDRAVGLSRIPRADERGAAGAHGLVGHSGGDNNPSSRMSDHAREHGARDHDYGTNRLVGTKAAEILRAAPRYPAVAAALPAPPEFWDGNASVRILAVLEHSLAGADLTASPVGAKSLPSVLAGPHTSS